jgi:hypothetical protein
LLLNLQQKIRRFDYKNKREGRGNLSDILPYAEVRISGI